MTKKELNNCMKNEKDYAAKILDKNGDLIVDGILTSRAKLLQLADMIDRVWLHDIKSRPADVDQNKQLNCRASNRQSINPGKIKENPYDPDSFRYQNHTPIPDSIYPYFENDEIYGLFDIHS